MPPLWEVLRALDLSAPAAVVTGEAALAGFWFHHRLVDVLEVNAADPSGPDALGRQIARLGLPLQEERPLPGFLRLRAPHARIDLGVELTSPLDPDRPVEDGIPCESLRDLAVDRWLRLLGRRDLKLLVDLYFLARARVDLLAAARDATLRDIGANLSALAVVLHEFPVTALPEWSVRPVAPAQLKAFAAELTERLALQTFR